MTDEKAREADKQFVLARFPKAYLYAPEKSRNGSVILKMSPKGRVLASGSSIRGVYEAAAQAIRLAEQGGAS